MGLVAGIILDVVWISVVWILMNEGMSLNDFIGDDYCDCDCDCDCSGNNEKQLLGQDEILYNPR